MTAQNQLAVAIVDSMSLSQSVRERAGRIREALSAASSTLDSDEFPDALAAIFQADDALRAVERNFSQAEIKLCAAMVALREKHFLESHGPS